MNTNKTVTQNHDFPWWRRFSFHKNLLLFLWMLCSYNNSSAQDTCPQPIIVMSTSEVCNGDVVTFSAPDTGFDCLDYYWNFGIGATPTNAFGVGPHYVTYSNEGSTTVTLQTNNNCASPTSGNVGVVCPDNNQQGNGVDCCGDEEKIKKMTFTYIGGSCPGNNSQGSGSDCSGSSVNSSSAYIKAKKEHDDDDDEDDDEDDDDDDDNEIYFSGNVSLGEDFVISQVDDNDLPHTVFIEVNDQLNEIHTSCSIPLIVGETYGALLLKSIKFKDGSVCNIQPNCIDCQESTSLTIDVNSCSPCDEVTVTKNNTSITVDGLDAAANSSIQIYNDNWVNVFTCQGNCNTPSQTISGLEPGEHHVIVKLTTPSWSTICEKQEDLILNNSTPSLSINDVAVNESSNTANLNICLSSASNNTVTVNYQTVNGTAVATSDYAFSSGQVTLLAGQTCASVNINIQNDSNNEPTETFSVLLSSPNNATIADDEGMVTIQDDDPVAGNPCDEIDVSSSNGNIIVSGLDASPISVLQVFDQNWSPVFTCSGNCNATETISVSPGLHYVKVKLRTASWVEICETLEEITVSGGAPTPSLSFSDIIVNESIGSAVVEVCLSSVTNNTVTANYQTASNSATNNIDYSFSSGQIQIPAGQSCSQINIPIIDDSEEELEESFFLNFSNPANATLASTYGLVTIEDNDQVAPIDCSNINISSSNGNIIVTGLDSAPISKLQVFDNDWNTMFSCLNDCNPTETVALSSGDYRVFVTLYDGSWQSICQVDESISISNNGGSGGQPSLSINDATVNENAGIANVQVCLSAPTSQMVIFEYATVGGTAVNGLDYNIVGGNQTIPVGGQCTNIVVPINNDNTEEVNETFSVIISNPVNSTVAGAEAIVTILDDDAGNNSPNCDDINIDINTNNGTAIEISNLTAPISIVQVFDADWNQVFACSSTCNSSETVNLPNGGTHYVKATYYTTSWTFICEKAAYVIGGSGTNIVTETEQDDFYFTVQKGNRKVNLNWTTNTEFKNEYFIIERSVDGVNFETLAEVNSDYEDRDNYINYQNADLQPLPGVNFYRIKKMHRDGSHIYSVTKEVSFDLDLSNLVIFPNPANNNFFINMKAYAGMKGEILVHNCLGQLVLQESHQEIPNAPVAYSLDRIASGIYTVTLKLPRGKQVSKKLLVTKL